MGKVVGSVAKVVGGVPYALATGGNVGSAIARNLQLAAAYFSGGPIGVAAAAVSMVASDMQRAKAPRPNTGGSPVNYRQSVSDAQIIYGKARVGGLINFYHPTKVGKFDYRYFVVTLAGHEIEGVNKYWLNDEEVTVDGSGLVTSGKYASNCWIWPDLGTSSATANATFVAETGGKWTADHRGRGVAKLYVKFKLTDEVIAEGLPNITCEVEGKNDIYDPRDESTGYTNNAALCFYDWLLLPRDAGGFGAAEDDVDWDFVATQASVCDETVALAAGGTEARYACDGVITAGASPDEIRDALLTSFAGEFTYSGGVFKAYAGCWRGVVGYLSEDDLTGGMMVSPLSAGDTIANQVRGTFLDPRQKYQPQEFPARTLTTDDDLRTLDMDLPFTKSVTCGQRIAEMTLRRASAERTVTWPMNLKGLAFEAFDTLQADTTRYNLSNYSWKVAGWSLNEDFSVALQLREEAPEFYEWATADEIAAPIAGQTITNPPASETGGGEAVDDLAAADLGGSDVGITFTMPDTETAVAWTLYSGTLADASNATVIEDGLAAPNAAVSVTLSGQSPGLYYFVRTRTSTGAYSPLSAGAQA